jgi:hypothetical protein
VCGGSWQYSIQQEAEAGGSGLQVSSGHRVETLFQKEEESLVVCFRFPQELVQGHGPVVRLVVFDKITECFSFCSDPLGTPFYPSQPVYQSAPIIVPTQQQPPPAKREKKTVRDLH